MTLIPWWAFATGASLLLAAFMLANQQLKLRAELLVVWRGWTILTVTTPVVFFIELPSDPGFYLYTAAAGAVAVFADMRLLHISSTIGAGPLSRLMPTAVWLSFLLWIALSPAFRDSMGESPFRFAGVIAALIICVGAAIMLRKDAVSRAAIIPMIPVILGSALIDNFNKLAMIQADDILTGAIAYAWVQAIVNVAAMGVRLLTDKSGMRHAVLQPAVVKGGLILGAIILSLTVMRTSAMASTPNPGYVAAIGLGATVWIMGFNRWRAVSDASNILAGLAFVASAVILILMTA